MDNDSVFNTVIILFIIMCAGFYGRRKNIISEELNKGLTEVLLRITLPMMIITSFTHTYSKNLGSSMIKLVIYSIVIHVILIVISRFAFFKLPKDKKDILRFVAIFSNCGFMGFPVLKSAYGDLGVLYGSVFNIPFYVFVWTLGIALYTDKKDPHALRKIFFNPGIISVVIGLIIFATSIKLPVAIVSAIKIIGDMTTPLSMMIIGYMISGVKLKEIFKEISLYYGSFVRLIVAPTITYMFFSLMGADKTITNVAVIIEAMPVAAVCAIYAKSANKNPRYASLAVFITTLLSLLTIPVVLYIIN
ncbi:AEC family transporter [Clostridium bovifaecis]|uniref:AEC family transporter n=1 Tax=Clostridium bovifaecis TaxID=2184719 RepID=A0A6I6ERQ1_9CLOT|nr:AEC family transporter [Clostridium bovifaecis]